MEMQGILVMQRSQPFFSNIFQLSQPLLRLLLHRNPTSKYSPALERKIPPNGLLLIVVFLVTACDAGNTEKSIENVRRHPIRDSGFGSGIHQVYWLDNENVIFGGYEGMKPNTIAEKSNVKRGIYVWNIERNAISLFARNGRGYCYYEDKIYYVHDGHWAADWGDVKRTDTIRPKRVGKRKVDYLSFNCLRSGRRHKEEGRSIVEISSHETLDFGPARSKRQKVTDDVRYVYLGGSGVIDLGVEGSYFNNMKHYAFRRAYFSWRSFAADRVAWETTGCETALWLSTLLRSIEEVCIPFGPWATRGSLSISPTMSGLFVVSHGITREGLGVAGGYLVTSDRSKKVISGLIHGAGVSPNGCKIAFSHAPDLEATRTGGAGRRTLKVIDVCEQQRDVT